MIGDTRDYLKLNQMVKSQKHLDVPPSQFILGSQSGGDEDADDLYVGIYSIMMIPTNRLPSGMMTHRSARATMSPKATWWAVSRTEHARQSAKSNLILKLEPGVPAACL